MKQNVDAASIDLVEKSRSLGTTTNDYAYWDRTYEFMADPAHGDIAKEFQNGGWWYLD